MVAASGGVWLLQSTEVFARAYSGHGVVNAYVYYNLAIPFATVLYSTIHFHALKEKRASELMDSTPVSNGSLYLATYISLVAFFLIIELIQFSLMAVAVSLSTEVRRKLDYEYFLALIVPNTLSYISLGAFLGVMFRDLIPPVVTGFLLVMADKLQYIASYQSWVNMLNSHGVTRDVLSDFSIPAIDRRLFLLNRLFFLALAALLAAAGFLLFKRNRQRRTTMPLRVALVVVSLVLCVSIARSYDSIKTVPVSTEKARISAYLASDRLVYAAGATEYPVQRSGLKFGGYQIDGSLTKGVLQASASFKVTNPGPDPQRLEFFLADGLEVRSVTVSGEEMPFKRNGMWWSVDCPPVAAGADIDCTVSYGGTISEYAKDVYRPPLFVLYRLYGCTDDNFTILPSGVGWYPMDTLLYGYALDSNTEWLIPQGALKTDDFVSAIDGDIPIFSHGRFVIGYPGLATETLDGIHYVYLEAHRPLIHRFHQSVSDRLLFYQELIPQDITIVEIPNFHILSSNETGLVWRTENGNGLVIIGEGTLSALASKTDNTLMARVPTYLWSGWLSQPAERGPSGSEGYDITSAASVALGQFMEYLYQMRNSEEAAEAHANQTGGNNPFLEVIIAYYRLNGLERAKELLRSLHERERERGLKQEDYAELMGIRFVIPPGR